MNSRYEMAIRKATNKTTTAQRQAVREGRQHFKTGLKGGIKPEVVSRDRQESQKELQLQSHCGSLRRTAAKFHSIRYQAGRGKQRLYKEPL